MADEIKEIYRVLTRNQAIAEKFFRIESEILTISNYRDFFDRLMASIQDVFNIPHAWLSVIDQSVVAKTLRELAEAEAFTGRVTFIDWHSFSEVCPDPEMLTLANRDMKRFAPLLPEGMDAPPASMAVVPLTLDGKLVGSLNLGDDDKGRYHENMETFFLSQLSVKISLCLTNVAAHEKLVMLATRDSLTGLFNRAALQVRLKKEFDRARRYGSPLSLAFIDMDGFKAVNDTFGHDQGDVMLRFFARHLKELVRTSDTASRFAGDEFVIVLPGITLDQAHQFMARVERHFQRHPAPIGDEQKWPVRFSFGVAGTEEESLTSPGLLLKQADTRLYDQKAQRRGQAPNPAPAPESGPDGRQLQ